MIVIKVIVGFVSQRIFNVLKKNAIRIRRNEIYEKSNEIKGYKG